MTNGLWGEIIDEDQGRLIPEMNICREKKKWKNEKMFGKEMVAED